MRSLLRRVFGREGTRALATNSIWSIAATGVRALAVLAETVLLTRFLTPTQLGVFLLVLAFPEAVQQVLDFRVTDATIRYLGEFVERAQPRYAVALLKLLWLVDVAVGAIAFGLVAGTAWLVAPHLLQGNASWSLIVIYAFGVFIGTLDTASGAVMRVLDQFGLAFLVGGLADVVRVLGVAAALSAGAGLTGLVWTRVAVIALTTVLLAAGALWASRSFIKGELAAPVSLLRPRLREITHFLVGTNLIGVIRALSTKLDVILIGFLLTPAAVAVYKVALQFARLPLLLSDALYIAVYPQFAREVAGANRLDDAKALGAQLSRWLLLAAIPATAVGIAFSEPLIELVAGEDFGAAAAPFRVILLGIMPWLVVFWTPALILSMGRARTLMMFGLVSVVAQFAVLVAAVPFWGASGAAAGVASAYLVAFALHVWYVRRL